MNTPAKYLESYPGQKVVMVNRADLEEWAAALRTHQPAEPVKYVPCNRCLGTGEVESFGRDDQLDADGNREMEECPTCQGTGVTEPDSGPTEAVGKKRQTPWDIACGWYGEDEMHRAIHEIRHYGPGESKAVPRDVFSREFSKWLTHQYRLAMSKGIQLANGEAQSAITAATAELQAKVERLEGERNCLARAIVESAAKLHITDKDIPRTGPEVLALMADIESAVEAAREEIPK